MGLCLCYRWAYCGPSTGAPAGNKNVMSNRQGQLSCLSDCCLLPRSRRGRHTGSRPCSQTTLHGGDAAVACFSVPSLSSSNRDDSPQVFQWADPTPQAHVTQPGQPEDS